MTETSGIWIAALLTLAMFSYLYKAGPAYYIAEHLYVGVAAGYYIATTYHSYIKPTVAGEIMGAGKYSFIVPIAIGLMVYLRFVPSLVTWSRIPTAFFLGVGAGIVLTKDFKPMFMEQLAATLNPLWIEGAPGVTLNNWILLLGVASSLAYFFFTAAHRGALGVAARLGRCVMLVAFGAAFGTTVMGRVSLLIGRMQFLLGTWLGLMPQ